MEPSETNWEIPKFTDVNAIDFFSQHCVKIRNRDAQYQAYIIFF